MCTRMLWGLGSCLPLVSRAKKSQNFLRLHGANLNILVFFPQTYDTSAHIKQIAKSLYIDRFGDFHRILLRTISLGRTTPIRELAARKSSCEKSVTRKNEGLLIAAKLQGELARG